MKLQPVVEIALSTVGSLRRTHALIFYVFRQLLIIKFAQVDSNKNVFFVNCKHLLFNN